MEVGCGESQSSIMCLGLKLLGLVVLKELLSNPPQALCVLLLPRFGSLTQTVRRSIEGELGRR